MISKKLASFEGKKVVVLGDVMLDRYLYGQVDRISPEAPVPVVLHHQTEDRLGGAANVALNLKALGAHPILVSVLGRERDAERFLEVLEKENIERTGILQSSERRSTVKTRIIGNRQQMLRLDTEDVHPLSMLEENLLWTKLLQLLESGADALIFQDYNKGVLTPNLIEKTVKWTAQHQLQTVVDPKKTNFFAYKGVSLFKPNLKEIRDALPFAVQPDVEGLQKAADYIRSKIGQKSTMITLSEQGVFLENGGAGKIFPTKPRTVADVSGAGDTVVAVATLALLTGMDAESIALLSNLAGGQVCEQAGVVPVDKTLLIMEFNPETMF